MGILLWIVQAWLAFMFFMAGSIKAFQYDKAKKRLPWVKEYSRGSVAFIGIAEVLGALGLILPGLFKVLPWLTPVAAIGLAVIMFLASLFHAKRSENKAIGMNVILLVLALFVVVGRIVIAPF